jgi:hypothetical protein
MGLIRRAFVTVLNRNNYRLYSPRCYYNLPANCTCFVANNGYWGGQNYKSMRYPKETFREIITLILLYFSQSNVIISEIFLGLAEI